MPTDFKNSRSSMQIQFNKPNTFHVHCEHFVEITTGMEVGAYSQPFYLEYNVEDRSNNILGDFRLSK